MRVDSVQPSSPCTGNGQLQCTFTDWESRKKCSNYSPYKSKTQPHTEHTFHLGLRPDVYPFMSQFLMKQPAYISHNTDASNKWQKAPPISLPRPHSETRTSFLIGSGDVTSYPWLANVSGPPGLLLKDSVPQCGVLRWPKQDPRIDKTRYADYQSRREQVYCIE